MKPALKLLALALVAFSLVGCKPLREDSSKIEEAILERTPLGSSKKEVIESLTEQRLHRRREITQSVSVIKFSWEPEEWATALQVHLGEYDYGIQEFLATDVVAYYVFDESGSLIKVTVEKEANSL